MKPMFNHDGLIQMIYPARRKVTPQQVIGWMNDAIANGECDPEDWDGSAEDAAAKLMDYGKFTFAQ